jgi:hypothetical protein
MNISDGQSMIVHEHKYCPDSWDFQPDLGHIARPASAAPVA